jgi:hypothetical protein
MKMKDRTYCSTRVTVRSPPPLAVIEKAPFKIRAGWKEVL